MRTHAHTKRTHARTQLLAGGGAGRASRDGAGDRGLPADAAVDLDLLPHLVVYTGLSRLARLRRVVVA
jgi:hypothetical protein